MKLLPAVEQKKHLEESYNKPRHVSSPTASCSNIHHQPAWFCVISRLTCFSCFVVITFLVLITQEFTFILKYTSYVSPSSSVGDRIFVRHTNVTGKKFETENQFSDDWREVTEDLYVYSAYWDTRLNNESFVRIVGGVKDVEDNMNSTKCLLKYINSSTIIEIFPSIEILIEHHNKPCKVVYIKCLTNTDEPPTHVALVIKDKTGPVQPSWMTVHLLNNATSSSSIGVCVRPMFNFTDTFRTAEFIAFYEALGVSQFTFYNYDITAEVAEFFHALGKEGYSIDVMPWTLPSNLDSMWAVGQMASINDCIYRNMGKFSYIVIVDLDEFITPRHVMTLTELMTILDVPKRHKAGFVLRSTVFCSEYEPDILPSVIPPFQTQRNIRRERYIYPFLVRSKYIVKPFMIEIGGIHQVWKFIPGWKERYVPASQALVHHYRADICVHNKTLEKGEIDVKSRKYLNQLMRSKAVEVWSDMFSDR